MFGLKAKAALAAVEAYKKAQADDPLIKAALDAAERAKEQRRVEQQVLSMDGPNGQMIQMMINKAVHGVVAELIWPNGSRVVLRREEDFDRFEKMRNELITPEQRQAY